MRENQKVAVKNLGKVVECTFFCKSFSIFLHFFLVYNGFYIIDPKFCAWKWKSLREKTHFCVRENLQLIREI